jgi:hypothetical protein
MPLIRTLPAALALLLAAAAPGLGEMRPEPTGCAIGAEVPYFYVREVTSDRPNLATCLVCRYGSRPVVLLCVRTVDDQVKGLIEAVDRAVDGGRGLGLRGFAISLAEKPAEIQPQFMSLARQRRVSLPLTMPVEAGGPRTLELPAQAQVTVLCYVDRKIVGRHILLPGELDEAKIQQVVDSVQMLVGS